MENMTYEELGMICDECNQRLSQLDYMNLRSDGDEEKWSEICFLNDRLYRYQKRMLSMNGKKKENAFLHPPVSVCTDGRRSDSGLYLITLSPPPESQTREFISAVHRFVNLKVVEEATYCFEQRGVVEGDYNGIHTHILCKRRSKPYAFNKELGRVFDKFFRQGFGSKQKNVENVEIKEKEKVIRYISGEKNGRNNDKKKKAENDKLFRRDWKLDNLYEVHA